MMKNQSLVHQGGSFSWGFQMVSEGKKQLEKYKREKGKKLKIKIN